MHTPSGSLIEVCQWCFRHFIVLSVLDGIIPSDCQLHPSLNGNSISSIAKQHLLANRSHLAKNIQANQNHLDL
jgi:hypothetical protein